MSLRHARRLLLSTVLCLSAPAFGGEPTLPGIDAAMQEMVAKQEIAGAVTVVVAKDKLLHLESTGIADVAAKRPMTPETLFWIASMTSRSPGSRSSCCRTKESSMSVIRSRSICRSLRA